MLNSLLTVLDTLHSTDARDNPIPGPVKKWSEALLTADAAFTTLALLLEEWEAA